MGKDKDFLDERTRAEDIILGGLGYGSAATIDSILLEVDGSFSGVGCFDDGVEFFFDSPTATELELWAIKVLRRELAESIKKAS